MTPQLIAVLSLLAVCVFFFVINKPRMDVVALLAMLALPLFGILTLEETFSGFSDASVILIGLMFVIGEGLVRTGVSTDIGAWILKKAGGNDTKLIVFMMTAVALIGSVMSSTGIVALFIPVVLGIASKIGVSPAKLMMPLSFAGLISGMMSLVATPPNMVMNSILTREDFEGFSFFDFTPIGLAVLVAGILYMLYARRFLGNAKKDAPRERAFREKKALPHCRAGTPFRFPFPRGGNARAGIGKSKLVLKKNFEHRLRLVAGRATAVHAEADGKRDGVLRQHFVENRLHGLGQEEAEPPVIEVGLLHRLPVHEIDERRASVVRLENVALDEHFVTADEIVVRRVFREKFDRAALVLNGGVRFRHLRFVHNHNADKIKAFPRDFQARSFVSSKKSSAVPAAAPSRYFSSSR